MMKQSPTQWLLVVLSGVSWHVALANEKAASSGAGIMVEPEIVILEHVTVTARREQESLQTVPISITVMDGMQLDQISPVSSNADIARSSPNISFVDSGSKYSNRAMIRGVGSLLPMSPDDTSVTFNVDEIPRSAFGLPPSTLDLERVEILRGPQGTLYGRGTQAGAINFIPNRPGNHQELLLRTEAGSNGWRMGEVVANAPLVEDRLAGRLALRYSDRAGDVRNAVIGGMDGAAQVAAARGTLLYESEAGSTALATVHYERQDDTRANTLLDSACYPCAGVNPRNKEEREGYGASLRVEHKFDHVRLTSLTGYQRTTTGHSNDLVDGLIFGRLDFPEELLNEPNENLTKVSTRLADLFQELRLSSSEQAAWQWTAGLNLFRSTYISRTRGENVTFPGYEVFSGSNHTDMTTHSYAVFGEVTVPLSDKLKGIAGLRSTYEDKSVRYRFLGDGTPGTVDSFRQNDSFQDNIWTGRLGLSFDWSEDVMLYGTLSHGAVAGGFPTSLVNVMFGRDEPMFPTSKSWSYEAGFKSQLWGGRLQLNGALFFNDVRDGHLMSFNSDLYAYEIAALDYRSHGFEIEGKFQVTRGLSVFGGVGYTKAEMHNVPMNSTTGARSGYRVPDVAGWTASVGVDYFHSAQFLGLPGDIYGSLSYQYVGTRPANIQNTFDLDAYQIVGARFGWQGNRLGVYFFAQNLFDERYAATGGTYGPGAEYVMPGVGRTVGVGVSLEY